MSNPKSPDPKILKLGSPTATERKYVEAWIKEGSSRDAAKVIGVTQSTVVRGVDRVALKRRATSPIRY